MTRLFHPRTDVWADQFEIDAGSIVGLTDIGRTSVDVLAMNDPIRVQTRLELEPERFARE